MIITLIYKSMTWDGDKIKRSCSGVSCEIILFIKSKAFDVFNCNCWLWCWMQNKNVELDEVQLSFCDDYCCPWGGFWYFISLIIIEWFEHTCAMEILCWLCNEMCMTWAIIQYTGFLGGISSLVWWLIVMINWWCAHSSRFKF